MMPSENTDAGDFVFSAENLQESRRIIAKYPSTRQASAVIPLLHLAQRQNGNWLSKGAMEYVARMLDMTPVRVFEVASFYTMFNLRPVGETVVQVCTTTPCCLRGALDIVRACEDKLGIKTGQTTADGAFTLREVECLGACVNAPVVQVNDDYFEDLTPETMGKIIDTIKSGKKPAAGSQAGRRGSCPEGGPTSLKEWA